MSPSCVYIFVLDEHWESSLGQTPLRLLNKFMEFVLAVDIFFFLVFLILKKWGDL